MSWRVRVAQVIARRSPRIANWWLRLTGSRFRIYSALKVYVGGVELREVRDVDFDPLPRRRRGRHYSYKDRS